MKNTTIDQLRQELASDEGCKYEIYLDHLNLPTFGIGHLIRNDDPEYGKPVGTVIEQERVDNVFKLDIAVTLEDCHRLYPDWNYHHLKEVIRLARCDYFLIKPW